MARARLVICGIVCSGRGKASQAMQGAKLEERSRVAGIALVPGTLNVGGVEIADAVAALGEPHMISEVDSKHGALRWWRVRAGTVRWRNMAPVPVGAGAFVVRHEQSTAPYLELVSDTHFRSDGGFDNGDPIMLELVG